MALTKSELAAAGELVAAYPDALRATNDRTERTCEALAAKGACAELKPRTSEHGEWLANPAYIKHLQQQAASN